MCWDLSLTSRKTNVTPLNIMDKSIIIYLSFLLWASRIGCRQKGAELHLMPRSFSLGLKVSSRYSSKAQHTFLLYHFSSTVIIIYLSNQSLERCIEIYQHPLGKWLPVFHCSVCVSGIRQFHKDAKRRPCLSVCLSVGRASGLRKQQQKWHYDDCV